MFFNCLFLWTAHTQLTVYIAPVAVSGDVVWPWTRWPALAITLNKKVIIKSCKNKRDQTNIKLAVWNSVVSANTEGRRFYSLYLIYTFLGGSDCINIKQQYTLFGLSVKALPYSRMYIRYWSGRHRYVLEVNILELF